MTFFEIALKGFKQAIPIYLKDGYTKEEIKEGMTQSKKYIAKINVSEDKKQAFYKAMDDCLKDL